MVGFMNLVRQLVHPGRGSILYNKWLLYALFLMAVVLLYNAVMQNEMIFVSYFVLIGVVISFFNKNLIIILTLTMALSAILKNAFLGTMLEGMEDGSSASSSSSDEKKPKESMESSSSTTKTATGDSGAGAGAAGEDASAATTEKKENGSEKKGELVDALKKDAKDLLSTQQNIIQGFQEIEPYMKQAETLLSDMDKKADELRKLNASLTKK